MTRRPTPLTETSDLAHQLFAIATGLLEDATEIAVAGQSAQQGPRQLTEVAQRLKAIMQDAEIVAESAGIIVRRSKP